LPHFRALMPMLLAALVACGPEDEPSRPSPVPPPPTDTRPHVTGSYEVTGTIRFVLDGQSDTRAFRDVLRLSNRTGSISALQLTIDSFGCGPRGKMTGEKTFSIEATTCPFPPEGSCTLSMTFDTGSGSGSQGSPSRLQLSTQGKLVTVCSGGTRSGDLFIEMSGPRSGQAMPEAGLEVLASPGAAELEGETGASVPLRTALEHMARAASF
jgi:hypothetical protein